MNDRDRAAGIRVKCARAVFWSRVYTNKHDDGSVRISGGRKKNNPGFLLSSPCAIMEDLNREIGWRDYCDRHIIGELKGK